jgi:hypothetical protein
VKKRLPHFMMLTIVSMIVSSPALLPPAALSESNSNEQAVENTYKAYVQAWKTKDIVALQNLISDDYMAVNFENRVSSKEIEIATAKNDAAWDAMNVDEIHARVFGASAIASGFISGARKENRRRSFHRQGAVPGGSGQAKWTMATGGHAIVGCEGSAT